MTQSITMQFLSLLLDTMKIGMKYGRETKNKAEKVRFEMIL